MEDFKPAHGGIPVPSPGTSMLCPCGKPWYMVNVRGGLLVMTNRGWKPKEPGGSKKVYLPGENSMTARIKDADFEEQRG